MWLHSLHQPEDFLVHLVNRCFRRLGADLTALLDRFAPQPIPGRDDRQSNAITHQLIDRFFHRENYVATGDRIYLTIAYQD